jgi:hypothetical protein
MTETVRLGLPLIDGAQAQKHVTHNEALALIDATVQMRVLDRTRTAPPEAPAEGDAHLVAAPATGAWSGAEDAVAVRQGGAWRLLEAGVGWLVWVAAEERLIVRSATGWLDVVADLAVPPTVLENLDRLGVGTAADAANPFAAKLNAVLFAARTAAEGGSDDLRFVVNKATATATGSLLFQSGWSGRAEIGLPGGDDLAFKVSPDGATWLTGLTIAAATGEVATRALVPAADNAFGLGSAARRWSQIHAATATISTSDARAKTEVADDVPGLDFVRRLRPVTYRFTATDGRAGRRRHCGLIAQQVRDALGGRDLALWTLDATSGLQGLRYEELVPVLVRAVQDLAAALDRRAAEPGAAAHPPQADG